MLLEGGIYTDSRANCSRRLLTVHAATTNCFIIFPRLNYLSEVSDTVHGKDDLHTTSGVQFISSCLAFRLGGLCGIYTHPRFLDQTK